MQFGAKYEPVFGRGGSATVARSPAFAAHLSGGGGGHRDRARVEVLGHLVVQDVGRAINPAAVEGQIHGGVVQGLGWALLEQMPYDAQGQLLAATLMDYALPQSDQAPSHRHRASSRCRPTTGRSAPRGSGEPPVVGVPAAVANAIADATGRRFTALPITGDAIRAAGARA